MARREIRKFVIGKDFSEAEIELLILKLAKWFATPECDRNPADPESYAKDVVFQCINAQTKAGEPWKNAPVKFADRVRIKAAYDIETNQGIAMKVNKNPDAVRANNKAASDNYKKIQGMNPLSAEFNVTDYRDTQEKKILEAYPDLDTVAMLPHVKRLSTLYAQQEMIDHDLLLAGSAAKRKELLTTMETLNKTIDSVLKILDIHPESIRKKIKESADGSLGDLVALLDGDEDFRKREKLWSLQAALQLWAMTVRTNGRGDKPQLSVWELWHMTRTAPMTFTCKSCNTFYPSLVSGFTPKQLKDLLKAEGILVERPVFPTLISDEVLVGLENFIDSLPEAVEMNGQIESK